MSLPLSGGRSSVPAAARPNDGTGSSDSGSMSVGREMGGSPGSDPLMLLHSFALPSGSGQGTSGREPAARIRQHFRMKAGLPPQGVASESGRPGADTNTRVDGSISGNELDQARVNLHGAGLAQGSQTQPPNQDVNEAEGQSKPPHSQNHCGSVAQSLHTDPPNWCMRRRWEAQEK